MKHNTTDIRILLAAATFVLFAGCNELPDPAIPGKGMSIKPVFGSVISSSMTKSGDTAESLTLDPLLLGDGTQIDMSVTKDTEWPIACPQGDAVLTKGTVYYGTGYESKKFRISAWNASQSNSVYFAAKEYTCGSNHNWSTEQATEWPGTSDVLAFVGVWDSSESATASTVSGKYAVSNWDVSGSYADQKDLRVAFATYPADHNSDVLLYFNPYMNAIRVEVGDLPSSYSVTKVELKGVGVKGTLVFPDTYTPALPVSGRDSYVGDWQSVTTGNLSITGNWTSGQSVTPAGTAFLIIDRDGSTLAGSIEVTFTDSFGNATVRSKNLSELGTDVKCGEAFTINIGSTFIYYFGLDDPDENPVTFSNTTSSETRPININSVVMINGGTDNPVDWEIKSVQVGSGTPQEINDESFSNIGGYSASRSGNDLNIVSSARTTTNKGHHDYWTNKDGLSGDTAGSGWSPKSWGSDGENRGTIDLSKYDFQNETTNNPMTTANCYVIRHAGTYKLPLVYGNGVVNGAFNVQSYAPSMATGGDASHFLSPFKNHLDYGISSPFIEYNTRNGNPGIRNYIVPSGSQILWQDEADIITINGITKESVTVKNASGANQTYSISYLTFTIPQDKICQNNALLAVTDESGTILWSWHIWITNDPGLLQSAIPVNNLTGVTYNFFPLYNLGWIEPEEYQAREDIKIVLKQKSPEPSPKTTTITVKMSEIKGSGNGCYYEFGRKDPMCRVDNPVANGGSGAFFTNEDGMVSLSTAILNPDRFYPYNGDWCNEPSASEHYYNLWTGKFSKAGEHDQSADIIKTIYDPSPRGYKMPASKAFTGFLPKGEHAHSTDSSEFNKEGDFNNGYYFYTAPNKPSDTIFFPAAGNRYFMKGRLSSVGTNGYYWTAFVCTANSDSSVYLNLSNFWLMTTSNDSRGRGFSVRPVLE